MTISSQSNIHQRIHHVMRLVERISKEKKNPHGGYFYIGHDDVTMALRRGFVEAGIVQTVTVKHVGRLESGGLGLTALVRWTSVDAQVDYVEVESYGEAQSMDKKGAGTPQQVGIALSFAVKLAQLKNFALVGDDTPDPEQFGEPPPPPVREERRPAEPQADGNPEVKKFALAFKACTTMRRYDEVLAKAANIINTVTPAERAQLVAAAREAKDRILAADKATKSEEGVSE